MRKVLSLALSLLLVFGLLASGVPALAAESEEAQEPVLEPRMEAALAWALATAEDDSHGYSQANRFGPNYDCASFVKAALIAGGFDLELDGGVYTLMDTLPDLGFTVYEKGEVTPQRGDILIQPHSHVEICMGGTDCVAAHQDYDGRSGDSTGREIQYRSGGGGYCPFCEYAQYRYILRYEAKDRVPLKTSLSFVDLVC